MKKIGLRFLVALTAFWVGTAVSYVSMWDRIKTLLPAEVISFGRQNHSLENNSPYSVLEGTTVRIKPVDVIFRIPESWLGPQSISGEPTKNLYLSWQDLNELNDFDFNHHYGFDKEDSQVMRAALPFEDCAAHVGSSGWGNGRSNDLQVRVFVINQNVQEVNEKIRNQGFNKARSVFERAKLISEKDETWGKQKMTVLETGSHTLLFKDIDFYSRSVGGKTIVFVFVHQDGWDETIEKILDSFNQTNNIEN